MLADFPIIFVLKSKSKFKFQTEKKLCTAHSQRHDFWRLIIQMEENNLAT